MDLNDLAKQIFEGNKSRGFHHIPQETGTYLMLMVSELGEALEADRKGKWCAEDALFVVIDEHMKLQRMTENDGLTSRFSPPIIDRAYANNFETHIKDTHEDEIADTLIRILDYCGLKGIDIQGHVDAKLRYNSTRPTRHGKAY